MRTNLLLLSALAIVAMTGCTKDVDSKSDLAETTPAILEIKLAGSNLTRPAGGIEPIDESKISKGMIFVFKGTGVNPAIDAKAPFDFGVSGVTPVRVNITQGIRHVYVVANINPADFTSINTLSDLQNIATKLTLNTFRNSIGLPMSGFAKDVNTVGATTTNPLTVTIPLNFIGSKVHVDWDVNNLNPGLTGLVINGVAILNVNANSEYIATENGSGGYNSLTNNLHNFLQGIGSTSTFTGSYFPSVGATAATTNIFDDKLFIASGQAGFNQNVTYIFENHSQKPIIVAFRGVYSGVTYYWPVVINGALNGIVGNNNGDLSATVKRGTIYKVKAVIKGLGGDDPYAPIDPGAINVTVIPATWPTAIQIDQEFL